MTNPELDHLIEDDSWEDAGTTEDFIRELLQESDETARLYLRESWIANVFALLRDTRRAAGLTQQEVADRTGMKQSAIARLERAEDTKLSTLWNYLAACDKAPADFEAVALERLRSFALTDPGATRTTRAVESWKLRWVFDAPVSRRSQVSVNVEPRSDLSAYSDLSSATPEQGDPFVVAA